MIDPRNLTDDQRFALEEAGAKLLDQKTLMEMEAGAAEVIADMMKALLDLQRKREANITDAPTCSSCDHLAPDESKGSWCRNHKVPIAAFETCPEYRYNKECHSLEL